MQPDREDVGLILWWPWWPWYVVGWKRVIIRVNRGRWWLVRSERREGDISAGCEESHLLLYKV